MTTYGLAPMFSSAISNAVQQMTTVQMAPPTETTQMFGSLRPMKPSALATANDTIKYATSAQTPTTMPNASQQIHKRNGGIPA